ncbi:BgTH12-01002 [Blumeria graminis f. sp. triticale]|uniref:BgTH12-01002 n=1 Tax=Blumeria graminis f. sp. triticale TaxID=1689686 RepID=A0A9W4D813_BLUGR|nr:BgTH12-01002 [Blumeria graminis f. sp. triticale]
MGSQEATQPATQVVVDPHRLGQPDSDLSQADLADICCILQPDSNPARSACSLLYRIAPQYIVTNNPAITQNRTTVTTNSKGNDVYKISSQEIALRLSVPSKDPSVGGFFFGRNAQRCDILVGKDASKRISNIHFRIYINEFGYLLLEDLSTNGTAVDGVLLRANMKGKGLESQHVLSHGSLITLTMNLPEGEEDYRFKVRIPNRDSAAEEAYQINLTSYFYRVFKAGARKVSEFKNTSTNSEPPPSRRIDPVPAKVAKNIGVKLEEWKGGQKYNKVSRIGKGAFATVYLITSKYSGVPFAAKELEKRRFMKNGVLDPKLDDEMKIMRKINHPNIVRFVEHIDWHAYLYIIMEYIPGGDLGGLISQYGSLPEAEVKKIAKQLLSALKYLHAEGITHRDVKPDNILVANNSPLQVKLTDFGLSKMINGEETFLRTFCGTLLYCAPEVYPEYQEFDSGGRRPPRAVRRNLSSVQRYDQAIDIWSLAGVLYYSICGKPPYTVENGTNYLDLLTQIMTQPLDIQPLQKLNISQSGIEFIKKMLHNQPVFRATIEELEKSPWLTVEDELEIEDVDEVDMLSYNNLFNIIDKNSPHMGNSNTLREAMNNISCAGEKSSLTEVQNSDVSDSFTTSKALSMLINNYGLSDLPNHEQNKDDKSTRNAANVCLASSGALPSKRHEFSPGLKTSKSSKHVVDSQNYASLQFCEEDNIPELSCYNKQGFGSHDYEFRSLSLLGAESLIRNLNMRSPIPAKLFYPESNKFRDIESVEITAGLRRPREENLATEHLQFRALSRKRRCNRQCQAEIITRLDSMEDSNEIGPDSTNFLPITSISEEARNQMRNTDDLGNCCGTFSHNARDISCSFVGLNNLKVPNPKLSIPECKVANTELGSIESSISYHPGQNYWSISNYPNIEGQDIMFTGISAHDKQNQSSKYTFAKLVSTPDSCLPGITIDLVQFMTSWGRGSKATMRYPELNENRIPKYAFKIFLFRSGCNNTASLDSNYQASSGFSSQDMNFYISTKASVGIWVNDFNLMSYDRQNPNTESKYWGKLMNGDLITVWRHDSKPREIFTRFRFECSYGQSKESRSSSDQFQLIPDGPYLRELEQSCKKMEKLILSQRGTRRSE